MEKKGAGARILADQEVVLEILPGDAADPFQAASEWSEQIARLFAARGKGDTGP